MTEFRGVPRSLKEGGWGVQIIDEQKPEPGDKVEVTTSKGKTWTSTIKEVVWTGEDEDTGLPVFKCSVEDDRKGKPIKGGSAFARFIGKPFQEAGKALQANDIMEAGVILEELGDKLVPPEVKKEMAEQKVSTEPEIDDGEGVPF